MRTDNWKSEKLNIVQDICLHVMNLWPYIYITNARGMYIFKPHILTVQYLKKLSKKENYVEVV
jgi:hypothetical protein